MKHYKVSIYEHHIKKLNRIMNAAKLEYVIFVYDKESGMLKEDTNITNRESVGELLSKGLLFHTEI